MAPGVDPYGREIVSPLQEFVAKTITDARMATLAKAHPGIPAGMLPAVAIEFDKNTPLSSSEMLYLRDAYVTKCQDEAVFASLQREKPVWEITPAMKREFTDACAAQGVKFPPDLLPSKLDASEGAKPAETVPVTISAPPPEPEKTAEAAPDAPAVPRGELNDRLWKSLYNREPFSKIKPLLEQGADPNWKPHPMQYSSFMLAIDAQYSPEQLGAFMDKGARVNDQHGAMKYSALHLAIVQQKTDVVKFLLPHADTALKNGEDLDAAGLAKQARNAVLQRLVESSAGGPKTCAASKYKPA